MAAIMAIIFFVVVAAVSITANVILIAYIRHLLKQRFRLSDAVRHLLKYLVTFNDHVESVYKMPLFYEDDTLKALLRHSREATKYVKDFGDGFMWEEEKEIFDKQDFPEDDDEESYSVGGFDYGEEE